MPAGLAAAVAALAVLAVALGVWLPLSGPSRGNERLAALSRSDRVSSLEELELRQPFGERVVRPFIRGLAQTANRLQRKRSRRGVEAGPTAQQSVQLRLQLAGTPYGWTPADYLGTKVFAAVALGGAFFAFLTLAGQSGFAVAFALVGAVFGWLGPDVVLRAKTRNRQTAIGLSLPDALDLLVISVEAGLGFDAALQRMVEKKDNALTWEFGRMLAEMRVGRSRREALKDMVARTQVPDLSHFVNAVLQADQLGVSITKVLTVQAEQMRTLRRQRAEEKAAQLQLKLIVPLGLFIFPALCVVILGPIWPSIAAANAPGA